MLSWVVLSAAAAAAPSLKNAALLRPGVLQATRIFHTGQPNLAPVPPLPEHGGKVRFGLLPEEFFQFLYPKTGVTGPYVLGTGLILRLLSKEIYAITPETFSVISTIGFLVYIVKKYGASVADKLNEQKIAQLEEVKQASNKQIQDAIDMEKSQQAPVQKRHYLFDVQRNNIAMALEVTYREQLHRVYREVKNRLDYHISVQNYDASEGTRAHDKLGGEACGAEHLCTAGEGNSRQVHCRSKAARKEGSSSASYVNTSIPIKTARNS